MELTSHSLPAGTLWVSCQAALHESTVNSPASQALRYQSRDGLGWEND